jgi:3-isopropylmalate/(R)-2-methylmalate dehydratase small subunit
LLKYIGLAAVVADSISGTFFRNCVNYGFPAIQCAGVSDAFQDTDVAEIDLQKFEVRNVTRSRTLPAVPLPQQIMAILEAEGIVPLLRKEGYLS